VALTTAIERVWAWEALDSRGRPTVAVAVRLESGDERCATVPSGASTGSHEAHERRDGGERYGGAGVRGAVASVAGEIAAALAGMDARDQEGVDRALRDLDGTADLSRLGANAVLGVSVACARAAAAALRVPLWRALVGGGTPLLPLPMVNVISGGLHAGGLLDVQDVLVVPVGARSFSEAIEWAARVRAGTAHVLREKGFDPSLVADEGGLAAPLASNRAALDAVVEGIERAGLAPAEDVALALDVAATQLLSAQGYELATEGRMLTAADLIGELASWVDAYPIVSVEDALAEDDTEGWLAASARLAHIQLVGDDLFVTSPERLADGVAAGVANAVLVKPNQVGTLSAARTVVERAAAAGYATVLSARSGETEDSWLADLAVGWRTGQIKVGSTTRSERTSKWNRLLRIEAEEPRAVFAGAAALATDR
jgi:enolase 1/2/3